MKHYIYPGVISLRENKKFSVLFPDIPNCKANGKTLSDTLTEARELLEIYLSKKVNKQKEIPSPSKLKSIKKSNDSLLCLVEAHM